MAKPLSFREVLSHASPEGCRCFHGNLPYRSVLQGALLLYTNTILQRLHAASREYFSSVTRITTLL